MTFSSSDSPEPLPPASGSAPPPPSAPTPTVSTATPVVSRVAAVIGIVVASAVGIGVGVAVAGNETPKVETVREDVEVPVVPPECREAIGEAATAIQAYMRWQEAAREVFGLAADSLGAAVDLDYTRAAEINGELGAKKDLMDSIDSDIADASSDFVISGEVCAESE